jgi:hypothetical protein
MTSVVRGCFGPPHPRYAGGPGWGWVGVWVGGWAGGCVGVWVCLRGGVEWGKNGRDGVCTPAHRAWAVPVGNPKSLCVCVWAGVGESVGVCGLMWCGWSGLWSEGVDWGVCDEWSGGDRADSAWGKNGRGGVEWGERGSVGKLGSSV